MSMSFSRNLLTQLCGKLFRAPKPQTNHLRSAHAPLDIDIRLKSLQVMFRHILQVCKNLSRSSSCFSLTMCNQITLCSALMVASGWSLAPSPGWEERTPSLALPTSLWAPSASSWAWFCSSSTTNMTPATTVQIFQTKLCLYPIPASACMDDPKGSVPDCLLILAWLHWSLVVCYVFV